MPEGEDLGIDINGIYQPMCCPGCRAIASLITGNGMASFYQQRTAYNEKPDSDVDDQLSDYGLYDDPALSEGFTTTDEFGTTEARILLGGITCAACTWLIEQATGQLDGVSSAVVNFDQSRLNIRFDAQQLPLGQLFSHIASLGYQPAPFYYSAQRAQLQEEQRKSLRQLAVAGLGMMQVGMFAIALHAGDLQGMAPQYQGLLRWVSLLVSGFVVLYSARPFFSAAWRHLRQGALVMDLPVALAIGLAWLASLWATVSGGGQVYFDSVVMFTFFLLLGRHLERRMRQRHNIGWFDAQSALPSAVWVKAGDAWQRIARVHLTDTSIVLVKAGEIIAIDGEIMSGNSAVQEHSFNGEHLPRTVAAGDRVYASTTNVDSALEVRNLGSYENTRLAALQRSVEMGQCEKPTLARLADRIASWFVAAILLLTTATALVWSQLAPDQAFWIALSVLVISCPCALALATPAALTSAASALRANGVIVRGESALEALPRCTHLLLDKTGTLTHGRLSLTRVEPSSAGAAQPVLAIAAALQRYSNHPVARAFDDIDALEGFSDVSYQVGAGLCGNRRGEHYRLGSIAYCSDLVTELPPAPDEPLYWIALCTQDSFLAWIGLDDQVRDEAQTLIDRARTAGITTHLLTGDSSAQGPAMAATLGIDAAYCGLRPEQKMAHVKKLQNDGATVVMVGDGLNDAPVLGLADVSFAVSGATDLARTQADFVIADGDLSCINMTWDKANHCRRVIGQNFAWALSYNTCAIPLAALGFVPPWAAALGMSLSSVLVVVNSLRLNKHASHRKLS